MYMDFVACSQMYSSITPNCHFLNSSSWHRLNVQKDVQSGHADDLLAHVFPLMHITQGHEPNSNNGRQLVDQLRKMAEIANRVG